MADPLVSVIIPTYNRANVICSAIGSVLHQTYKNIELIVVDDGSTDNTSKVLGLYENKINVIRQANAGPSAARNRGIELSKGEIVAFLDSDDLWMPTKIERQVDILQRAGKSVLCCLCNAILRDSYGHEQLSFDLAPLQSPIEEGIWPNIALVLSTRCVVFTQAVAIRRDPLLKTGGFDESLLLMEDYDLALRLSLEGPWAFTKEPLVVYQRGTDGLAEASRKHEKVLWESCVRLYRKILADNRLRCDISRRYLERRLRQAQHNLRISEKSQESSNCIRTFCTVLKVLQKMQNAIFRRSPLYPKLMSVPIDVWENYRKRPEEWKL